MSQASAGATAAAGRLRVGAADIIAAMKSLENTIANAAKSTTLLTQTAAPANAALSTMTKTLGGGLVPAANAATVAQTALAQTTAALTTATAPAVAAQSALAKTTTALAATAAPAVAAHVTLASAAKTAVGAHQAHTGAMVNSRIAMMEFEHVARAMVDGLAAGMSPMRLLAMEGSRLAQAFQMSGGASGVMTMFRGALSGVASAATGTVGAVASVVAVGVGGAAAFAAWESRVAALQTALNGLGRSTGLTVDALNRVALGAAGGYTSIAQAQNATATLAGAGVGSGMIGQLASGAGAPSVIQQYANVTGSSFSDATTKLAADFSDPTKGAETLNKQFGFLNDSTLRLIANLQASGHMAQAQGVLFGALKQDLSGATDTTWSFAKAWDAVATGASNAASAVGSAVQRLVDPSLEQRYSSAVSGFLHYNRGSQPGQILAGQVDDYGEQLRRRGQAASQRGQAADAARQSTAAGDIVRQTVSEIAGRQSLVNQRDALSNALGTPGARAGLDPATASEADEALARLSERIKNFATSAERVAQDSTSAAQAIQAETGQQRTAIEALKAFNDVLRDSGDRALAAATAQAKWNEAIAASNKQADDALRSANQRLGLIGLSPLQRDLQENRNRFDDMRRGSVTGPGGVSSRDGAFTASAPGSYRSGISGIESGGNYGALGPLTKSGDRAYGKYQVMGANIPQWTKSALGRSMTSQEFLADSKAQDAVFDHQFGGYAKKYGPADAASMWLTGRTLANGGATAADQNGTTGAAYASRFMAGSGGAKVATWADVMNDNAKGTANIAARTPGGVTDLGEMTVNTGPASRSSGTLDAAEAANARAIVEGATSEKMRLASEEVQRNQQLLEVRTKSIGLSTEAMEKAVHVQEIWNELQAAGVTKATIGSDAYAKLSRSVQGLATQQTSYDTAQQRLQQTQDAQNSFDQMGRGFVSSAGNDLGGLFNANPRDLVGQLSIGDQAKFYSGQLSGGQVKSMVAKNKIGDLLRNMLFQSGIGMVQKGLFGGGGSDPNKGLLGGAFSSLLGGITGGGGSAAGGIGSDAVAGAAGGGGGLFGSLFSGIGHLFGFAGGGVMTNLGPLPLRKYAAGGVANSPQVAMFGEGKNPEAYVPLADGRTIPVTMRAPQFGGGPANSNVQFQGGDLHVHGSIDSASLPQVQAMIETSNRQTMNALQRNFGNMNAKWQQRQGA